MWADVGGCGRMWADVGGCGRMWAWPLHGALPAGGVIGGAIEFNYAFAWNRAPWGGGAWAAPTRPRRGPWPLAPGPWPLAPGPWPLALGPWPSGPGRVRPQG